MPRISRKSKRNILLFIAAWALAFLFYAMKFFHCATISTMMYSALIILWARTVRRRILSAKMRRYLALGADMLLLLFVLRTMRYELSNLSPWMSHMIWQTYYIPFSGIPLISLYAALCVGTDEEDTLPRIAKYLWVIWGIFCVLILTNGLHGMMIRFVSNPQSNIDIFTHGQLYYLYLLWDVGLAIAAFGVLFRRCRLSRCRRLWFIAVLSALPGMAMLTWYVIVGGSPSLFSHKLFHIHETFAMVFLGLWESCIQIGLVPSNTDYDTLFTHSHLNAALMDTDGNAVLRAEDYDPGQSAGNAIWRSYNISGGRIVWLEDLSAIHRLNEEIEAATETIQADNYLLAEENKLREEQLRSVAQNRLYDRIAVAIRPQLDALDRALDIAPGDADFSDRLRYAAVLGAYVKRRANMELLAEADGTITSGELWRAISESFDYLTMTEACCDVRLEEDAAYPTALIISAYAFFEAVLEAAYPSLGSFAVLLKTKPVFSMDLELDCEQALLELPWEAPPVTVLTCSDEDGSIRLRLTRQKEEGK